MLIRRKKIRDLTLELLNKYRVTRPFVDVRKIAEGEGAIVVGQPADSEDVSGFVYTEGDRAVIGVNETHGDHRQRFTIAHEFGHLLLHADSTITPHVDKTFSVWFRDSNSSKGEQWQEIEANLFAAELLMPEHFLRERLQELSKFDFDRDADIEALADLFKVSTQAMLIRLGNLGYLTM